jgi:hypothetical protein
MLENNIVDEESLKSKSKEQKTNKQNTVHLDVAVSITKSATTEDEQI